MQIVVLDGHALNPGDLSWAALATLGPCLVHDRTQAELTVPRAAGAPIVLTNKVVLGRAEIAELPDLRYIGVLATGYNVVDIAAARERDITVTNIPTYGTMSVAQHVFALLLELTQHAGAHAETVLRGDWSRAIDWCYWNYPLVELDGLTLGIVGLGRIGQAVARIGQAFGLRVLAYDAGPAASQPAPQGVTFVPLEELFRASDVVTLHCPLTPETERLVDGARLALMKPTAFLINTARGPLVDETALSAALNAGRLAGAGLDVLSREPPDPQNPLLSARNCLITPHQAWATRAARGRLLAIAVDNVRAFLAGRPQNVV